MTYLMTDRDDNALADFSEAIELDSASATAYAFRGLAYEAMGREQDAAADYSRAVELEPGFSDMLFSWRNEIPRG